MKTLNADLADALFVQKNMIQNSEYKKSSSTIFPFVEKFKTFLSASGDHSTELTKDIIDTLGFQNLNAPPILLHRQIMSLQKFEQSNITARQRYSRDHVKHIVYLYLTGILVFGKSKNFHLRITSQIQKEKKRSSYSSKAENYALFSRLWNQFVSFHDIGYPIEQLSDPKMATEINANYLRYFRHFSSGNAAKQILTFLSNISVVNSIIKRMSSKSFENEEYQYFSRNTQQALETTIEKDVLARVLSSIPIAEIKSELMVNLFLNFVKADRIFFVIDTNDSNELVCIRDGLGSDLFLGQKNFKLNQSRLFQMLKCGDKAYSIRVYMSNEIHQVFENTLRKLACDRIDLDVISDWLETDEKYLGLFNYNEQTLDNVNNLAFQNLLRKFGTILEDVYLERAKRSDLEIIEGTISRNREHIVNFVFDTVRGKLLGEGKLDEKIETVIGDDETKQSVNFMKEMLYYREVVVLTISKINASHRSGKAAINSFIEESIGEIFKDEVTTLDDRVLKLLRKDSRIDIAFSNLTRKLLVTFNDLFESTRASSLLTNELEKVSSVKSVESEYVKVYEKLRGHKLFGQVFSGFENIIDTALDYAPEHWRNDHGLVSALYYLSSVEYQYQFHQNLSLSTFSGLSNLFTDCHEHLSSESILHYIRFEMGICFPAMFYHNYYPSKARDKNLRNTRIDFLRNPFVYLAILVDSLHNWDRDQNYNPGKENLSTVSPKDFMNIRFWENKIIAIINSKYADENQVLKWRESYSEYLKDISAVFQVRLSGSENLE